MALTPQGMATEMENQLRLLWRNRFGHELAGLGEEDRQLLFLAISRGILQYLVDRSASDDHVVSTVDLSLADTTGNRTVEALTWNIDIPDIG